MAFGKILRPVFDPGLAVAPWWKVAGKTCVAAYQPKGAASLAASYVNLANPGTYDAAPGAAPTWASATGWTFDGVTQYLVTGIVPASGWSVLARFYDAGQNGPLLGCDQAWTQAGGSFYLRASLLGSWRQFGNGEEFSVAPAITTGVLATTPGAAYTDGAYDGVVPNWTKPAAGLDIYIGLFHIAASGGVNDSGGYFPNSQKIQAIAIYSDALTAGEVATVSAAMAAL